MGDIDTERPTEDRTWLPLDLREAVKGTSAEAKVREWYWRTNDWGAKKQLKIAALCHVAEIAKALDEELSMHFLPRDVSRRALELRAALDALPWVLREVKA